MKPLKLTINHNRVLSHYVELEKGDSIEFFYNWIESDRIAWASAYDGVLSANRKHTYENGTKGIYTCIINLFECVEISTADCETFEDYFDLLKKVFEDDSIPYRNIY